MLWMWKQNTKQGRGKSYGSEKTIVKMNDSGNSDHQSSIINHHATVCTRRCVDDELVAVDKN